MSLSHLNSTIIREFENGLSETLSSTGHALLGGSFIMVSVISSLLNLVLLRLLTKEFSLEESNAYTKLLLGLVVADTMEMSVVGIPLGINLWQEGETLSNDSLCAFTGGAHFVCDKSSVLLLLVLGNMRLRAMRQSVPPSKNDETVNKMLTWTGVVVVLLIAIACVLIPFRDLEYMYSERYYFCMWGEVGKEGWRSLTHELYWSLGFLLPNLSMSVYIAYLTWSCIGYVSEPSTCKSQVFLQAVKSDGDEQDTAGKGPTRSSITILDPVSKTGDGLGTPTSIKSGRSPRTSPSPYRSRAALQKDKNVNGTRTPTMKRTNFSSGSSIRTNFIPPTPRSEERRIPTVTRSNLLNAQTSTSSAGALKSPRTGQFRVKVFDTEMLEPEEGSRGRSKSRESDESLQLRLSVLNRKRFIEGHKTICLLLLVYTVLNLPRWITLLLEFILRMVFERYSNGLLIVMCGVLSSLIRCALTTAALWWRILSVHHIIGEP